MARGNFLQTSFLGGEWSPFSQGKSDQQDYYTGLNLALNFLPTDEGALVRRSGTRFSAHAKDNTGDVRLIPFISESGDALVCEATDGCLRFHTRGTLLTEDQVGVVAITAATPAVVATSFAHGFSANDTVVFVSPEAPFSVPVRNKQYNASAASGTSITLQDTLPVGTGDTDGTELNGILSNTGIEVARVVERTIPYSGDQLAGLKYTEEEDLLYLFHPDIRIQTVAREDLTVAAFNLADGPYMEENETTTELSFSGTAGTVTVTASATTGINDDQGFLATDIGRPIRVNSGTDVAPNWSWIRITGHTSSTVVTGAVLGTPLATPDAVTTWRLGVFSDTTGWPTHGVIHEGRLFLISDVDAGRVDASRSLNFRDFAPTAQDGTVADDNAVSAIFAGAGRQNGRWLQSVSNGLIIGTDGGEYILRASSFDDPISPFSVQVRRHTTYGSSNQLPIRAGRTTLFVQELGRSLFEFRDIGGGQYDGNDLSRQASHLTTEGIIETAYQKIPNPVVWCLRGDRRLIGCTFRDDLEGRQVAWHRHSIEYDADVLAGEDAPDRYLQGGRTNSEATISSIATAPFSDPENTRNDNLWVAVQRGTTTCIEYLTPIFDISFSQNEGFFSDSGNIYYQGDKDINWEEVSTTDGLTTVRFFGLDRLEGKLIDGIFRGFDIGSAAVTNGQADFVFSEDLLTSAAAIDTVPDFTLENTDVVFNSGIVSTISGVSENAVGRPNPQSTIITGEDGVRYYVLGGGTGLGSSALNLIIQNADTGEVAFNRTDTELDADELAAGITPPGGDIGISGFGSQAAVAIPDTPYIVLIRGRATGPSSQHKILYYRIDDTGSLVLDGGYSVRTDGLSVQFSPIAAMGEALYVSGHILSNGTGGVNNSIGYRYPIGIGWHGESRSTVIIAPSINFILNQTPINQQLDNTWRNVREFEISRADLYGSNIFNLADSPQGSNLRSRGFYLPRADGLGSYLAQMFYLADLEAHDAGTETTTNPFLDANASANVTGLISTLRHRASTVLLEDDPIGMLQVVSSLDENANDLFDVFPFPDTSENFAGVVGSSTDNYYVQPTVLPVDPDDPGKPWLLFFPKIYRSGTDRDKMGLRIYEWNPASETARFLSFQKGQMYTLGTDVDSDVSPSSANVHWDRDTGQIDMLIRSNASFHAQLLVATFGTFNPTVTDAATVDARHVDAVLGCNYRSRAQTLRPDAGAGAQNGPGLGKMRRVDQYAMLTFQTGQTFIGTDFVTMFPIEFENPEGNDDFNRAPLFSNTAHGSLQATYDFDNLMAWEVRRPFPGAFISIAGFSNTSDR